MFKPGWKTYRTKYYIREPWVFARDVYHEFKYAFQRAIRGYDETVSWSIDGYLCEMLPIWLKELRDNKVAGALLKMYDEDTSSGFDGEITKGEDEVAYQYWADILTQMITGFEAGYKISSNEFLLMDNKHKEEYRKLTQQFNNGMHLFKKYFFNLWW
jgi:hypothetical protein